MLIYRDCSTLRSGAEALEAVRRALLGNARTSSALTLAGAVESALCDAGAPPAATARQLTDLAADAWLGDATATARALALLPALSVPEQLRLVKPEGFAFYALDPAAYAELASELAAECRKPPLVIGVRSIGTTLSAIVRAALERAGLPAQRITVRPGGHPWERTLAWKPEERDLLAALDGADVLVVDEGPGLSGSTFLAVGEALLNEGVPRERIRFLGSRTPDPDQLRARDGAQRWRRFSARTARSVAAPPDASDVSGGRWRELVFEPSAPWPAVWAERERLKYLRLGERELVKFAGFPPYGDAPLARAACVAEAGFGPAVRAAEPGFHAFEWVNARPAAIADRATAIERVARYLAFRAEAFRVAAADCASLMEMTRVNVHESLGVELPASFELVLERPVIADAQLAAHEWLIDGSGRLLKTDSADHGDDHLFPGPCDAAWDVAGMIVEWDLDSAAAERFLGALQRLTSDPFRERLPAYVVAYTSFRAGVASFAEQSGDDAERARWRLRSAFYRERLKRALAAVSR